MSKLEIKTIPVAGSHRPVYRVFDGSDAVSAICGTYQFAEMLIDRIEKERLERSFVTRTCMCCKAQFQSEGRHNRLCNDCRKTSLDGCSLGCR